MNKDKIVVPIWNILLGVLPTETIKDNKNKRKSVEVIAVKFYDKLEF